jgi:hypothetical protein
MRGEFIEFAKNPRIAAVDPDSILIKDYWSSPSGLTLKILMNVRLVPCNSELIILKTFPSMLAFSNVTSATLILEFDSVIKICLGVKEKLTFHLEN